MVVFDDCQILDVTGPLEVFSSTQRLTAGAAYDMRVVASVAGSVTSTSGLTINATAIQRQRGPIDTLMIAGGEGVIAAGNDPELLHHIRRLARSARRVTSICTGAFLLAGCGLLDGKRAATHWNYCEALQNLYPSVSVDAEPIYVRDGNIWTSAGVTSGIDLTLALVADDHGLQAAATVARHLVVYLRRTGGQAQFSASLAAQTVATTPLADLLTWLPEHLDADLAVATLARRTHLSERQFIRVFTRDVGTSPARHVELLRLEAARRLLETTDGTVEHIAKACGFGTPETLHRIFRRRLNTTPINHRRHFTVADKSSI